MAQMKDDAYAQVVADLLRLKQGRADAPSYDALLAHVQDIDALLAAGERRMLPHYRKGASQEVRLLVALSAADVPPETKTRAKALSDRIAAMPLDMFTARRSQAISDIYRAARQANTQAAIEAALVQIESAVASW